MATHGSDMVGVGDWDRGEGVASGTLESQVHRDRTHCLHLCLISQKMVTGQIQRPSPLLALSLGQSLLATKSFVLSLIYAEM